MKLPGRAVLPLYAALLCGSLLSSCDVERVLVDPEVSFADGFAFSAGTGEVRISLGNYEEQLFTPLSEGDAVAVIYGFQGGTWIMPALRCTGGVSTTVLISADVTTSSGELVGHIDPTSQRLDRTPEGTLDAVAIAIPINRADLSLPLEDIYGETATLTITLRDGDTETTLSLEIMLIEG